MTEAEFDARIAEVMTYLVQARRVLDAEALDDLTGELLVAIGNRVDDAMEDRFRRRTGNIIPFPGAGRRDPARD